MAGPPLALQWPRPIIIPACFVHLHNACQLSTVWFRSITVLQAVGVETMSPQVLLFVLLSLCSVVCSANIFPRQLDAVECPLQDFTDLLEGFPTPCRTALSGFISISPEEYVERQEEVYDALGQMCQEGCLSFVADLVVSCVPSFRIPLAQACGSNGRFQCWQGPILNNGTGVNAACYPDLLGGLLDDACSDMCRDSIVDIRGSHGCCVNNVFNTTVFGSQLAELDVANGALWDACGVERLAFCPMPEAFGTESDAAIRPLASVAIITAIGLSVLF